MALTIAITKEGQDVFDLAIQYYGSVEAVFDLLEDNPTLSFVSNPANGTEIHLKDEKIIDNRTVNHLTSIKLEVVNFGITEAPSARKGIGAMVIGGSFIIPPWLILQQP